MKQKMVANKIKIRNIKEHKNETKQMQKILGNKQKQRNNIKPNKQRKWSTYSREKVKRFHMKK